MSLPETGAAQRPFPAPALECATAPAAEAEPCFRALVEGACDIVTLLGADGRILYDSPAVEPVLGHAQGELVGRNAFELVHPDDYPGAVALLLDALARPGAAARITLRFLHRDGGWRVLECRGRTLGEGVTPPRLVVTSRDVTGREGATRRMLESQRRLRTRVSAQAREREALQVEMLERLARAAEYRDDATGRHIRRVGRLSAVLAEAAGMPAHRVACLRRAAPLHDVGKLAIRDAILLKPGPLEPEELEVMRTHTVLGARLLSRGRSELVRTAERIALSHHEQWDGQGYPRGLRGAAIPLEARVVAVADFFDALTHDRPYRSALPRPEVLRMIDRERGRRFDPRLVECLLALEPGMIDAVETEG